MSHSADMKPSNGGHYAIPPLFRGITPSGRETEECRHGDSISPFCSFLKGRRNGDAGKQGVFRTFPFHSAGEIAGQQKEPICTPVTAAAE
ncbi:MAG: hypothetical protein WC100_16840 [Sterolibacterium sp.]